MDKDFQTKFSRPALNSVNDIRLTREDSAIAVRMIERRPVGIDVIPLERPDNLMHFTPDSFDGHRIHMVDVFENSSMNLIACAGEHKVSGRFSTLIVDLRMPTVKVAVRCPIMESASHPLGTTTVWP